MFEIISKILDYFLQFWGSLTPEQKSSYYDEAADFFDWIFRTFYRANSGAA